MNTIPQEDEFKNAPRLKTLHGIQPYRVPEGYFETLPQRIEEKIYRKEKRIRQLWNKKVVPMAVAASVVLALAIGSWLIYQSDIISDRVPIITPEMLYASPVYEDLDLTLIKEIISLHSSPNENNEMENLLLDSDFTHLFEHF